MVPFTVELLDILQVTQLQFRIEIRLLVKVLIDHFEIRHAQVLKHFQNALTRFFLVFGFLTLIFGQVVEDPAGLVKELVLRRELSSFFIQLTKTTI